MFVAGTFAFVHQPRTDPPHQWMKPEDRLDEHVDGCREVVMAASVIQLVGQHRLQLRRSQTIFEARGHQQYVAPQPDDTRFEQVRRRTNLKRLKTYMGNRKGYAYAHGGPNASPFAK